MSQEIIKQQIEAPATLERFTKIFGAIQKVDQTEAQRMFEVEKFQFMKELQEKGITDVTPVSAMGCFLDIVSNGLSFASSAKHVYLMASNTNVGTRENPKWEKRLAYSTSPDGKIFQAQRSGAIEYVTKPVIVYEGDDFAVSTNAQGEQIILHQVKFPRTSNKIIAGYVYVVFKGGKREPYWMDVSDIERLKGYSAKKNKNTGANALYTSNGGQIDPGFFGAKLINFALKNVRKSGTASQFEVNGDAGDAAIITGATEVPAPDEFASYEVTSVTTPVTQQPTQQAPATTVTTQSSTTISSPVGPEPF